MYELFYSYGGHGGPITTLLEARRMAKRLIRGDQSGQLAFIDIKHRGPTQFTSPGSDWAAFTKVETIVREDALAEDADGPPVVSVEHLTIYFDPEYAERDGKGHCVDIDHPDEAGSVGYRFEHPEEAADFVTEWLRVAAQHHTRRTSV